MAKLTIDEPALQSVVMGRLEVFAREFVDAASSAARAAAPVRTGELKGSIRPQEVRRTGPWRLETGVAAVAAHAVYVHEGTRPHVIRPRNARALRFEAGGRIVFAKRANHPGQRAQPFLAEAVRRTAEADSRIGHHGV